MKAVDFLVGSLFGLYQVVVLLRLLMQLVRTDFRNPIGRGIVQVTDPLIRPLRRVFPPIGKVDTASVLALLVVSSAKVSVLLLLAGGLPPVHFLAREVLVDIVVLVLNTYMFSIILNAILSFVAPGNYSPAQHILGSLCDPILNPVRRLVPSPQGLDLSPLWVTLLIGVLLRII